MTTSEQRALAVAADSRLVDDLGWCWWTQPRATRVGGVLVLGGITSAGDVVVVEYDLRRRTARKTALARLEPDDHNNPAVVARAGRPLLAFYSRHDADDAVRYRVGGPPGGGGAWGEERRLRFGGITTYAQVHAVGDELHLFTRVGDTAWGYARSGDWGATWSEPVRFLAVETDQETYMPTALLPDGRSLRVAVAGHPKDYEREPWHEVRACVVDLVAGEVVRPSGGAPLANLRDGVGLPLRGRQLELVHESPPGRTLNLFDVGDGGRFEVAFASKAADDASTRDARYHVAHLGAGGFVVEDVAPAGAPFGYIHAGFYVGGIAFPHGTPGGRAYVSREEDGIWHLEARSRSGDGTWSAAAIFEPSPTRLVRPWPVRDAPPGLDVVALELERYGDDYMETLSHLVGAAAPGA